MDFDMNPGLEIMEDVKVKVDSTLTSYKEHMKVKHENVTPYKCDQCHRSYGTKSRLKVHKRNTHQRIKCDECGQEYTFILKRHKATVFTNS